MNFKPSSGKIKTPIIIKNHRRAPPPCDGDKCIIIPRPNDNTTRIPYYVGGNNSHELPQITSDHLYRLGLNNDAVTNSAGVQVETGGNGRINIYGNNTLSYTQPCGLEGRVVIANGMIEQKEIPAIKVLQQRIAFNLQTGPSVRFIDVYLPCPSNTYTLNIDEQDGTDIGNNTTEVYINNIFLGMSPPTVFGSYTLANVEPTMGLELGINNFIYNLKVVLPQNNTRIYNVRFTYPGTPPPPYDAYAAFKYMNTNLTVNYSPYVIQPSGEASFQFQVVPRPSSPAGIMHNMLHNTVYYLV